MKAYNEVSQRDNSSESLQHVKVEIDESSAAAEDQPLIQMDDPEPKPVTVLPGAPILPVAGSLGEVPDVSTEETEPLGQLPVELDRQPSQTQF